MICNLPPVAFRAPWQPYDPQTLLVTNGYPGRFPRPGLQPLWQSALFQGELLTRFNPALSPAWATIAPNNRAETFEEFLLAVVLENFHAQKLT